MLHLESKPKVCFRLLIGLTGLVWIGCAEKPQQAPPVKKTSLLANAGQKAGDPATNSVPRSVFVVDKNAKDPFFPKSSRLTERTAVTNTQAALAPASTTPGDVLAALQAGFQGVIGAGENRLAVINNTILEPNRPAAIPVSIGGRSQNVQVRCRQILKNGVVLDIQGQAQGITITGKVSK
jgi:hypothetical protein